MWYNYHEVKKAVKEKKRDSGLYELLRYFENALREAKETNQPSLARELKTTLIHLRQTPISVVNKITGSTL
jgi:hypothetical protein